MIEVRLGNRYAKSILGLAKEKGTVEDVFNDFNLIESVCQENPDFVKMLKSPLIYSDKKQSIISEIFKGKLSKMTETLIEIIIRKKREPWLRDIALRFIELYNIEKNITTGILTSSVALTEKQRQTIREMVEKQLGTTFQIEERVDPNLIGGFVLRVGDTLYDGSIASNLRKLRQEFSNNDYIPLYDV